MNRLEAVLTTPAHSVTHLTARGNVVTVSIYISQGRVSASVPDPYTGGLRCAEWEGQSAPFAA